MREPRPKPAATISIRSRSPASLRDLADGVAAGGAIAARRPICPRARPPSRRSRGWSAALFPRHFGPSGLRAARCRLLRRAHSSRKRLAHACAGRSSWSCARRRMRTGRDHALDAPRRPRSCATSPQTLPQVRAAARHRHARGLRRRPLGEKHRRDHLLLSRRRGHHPPSAGARSSIGSARPCSRASSPKTRIRAPASTSIPAPRSAKASSSTTAPAW